MCLCCIGIILLEVLTVLYTQQLQPVHNTHSSKTTIAFGNTGQPAFSKNSKNFFFFLLKINYYFYVLDCFDASISKIILKK